MISCMRSIGLLFCVAFSMSLVLGACGNKKEPRPDEALPAAETAKPAAAEETPAVPKEEPKPAGKKTLANAMNAFNGESNAQKRYEAFAAKADEEGYKDVANLFRAASKAESIHTASLAEVITKLGGTPTPTLVDPEIKTTAENVQAALAGETEEATKMYP